MLIIRFITAEKLELRRAMMSSSSSHPERYGDVLRDWVAFSPLRLYLAPYSRESVALNSRPRLHRTLGLVHLNLGGTIFIRMALFCAEELTVKIMPLFQQITTVRSFPNEPFRSV